MGGGYNPVMLGVYDLENKLHSQTSWHLAFGLTLLPMGNAISGSNTGWSETGYMQGAVLHIYIVLWEWPIQCQQYCLIL